MHTSGQRLEFVCVTTSFDRFLFQWGIPASFLDDEKNINKALARGRGGSDSPDGSLIPNPEPHWDADGEELCGDRVSAQLRRRDPRPGDGDAAVDADGDDGLTVRTPIDRPPPVDLELDVGAGTGCLLSHTPSPFSKGVVPS